MFTKKNKTSIMSICLLILSCSVYAIDLSNTPRALALGGNLVASVEANDGILAQNPGGIIFSGNGLSFYFDNPFSISGYEVNGYNVNYNIGKLGVGASYFVEKATLAEESGGNISKRNHYSKAILGLGLGGKAFGSLGWGLSFWQYDSSFFIVNGTNQRSKESALGLGILVEKEKWALGLSLNGIPVSNSNILLLPESKLGLRFGEKEKVSMLVGIERYENALGQNEIVTSSGIEARLASNLTARLGYNGSGLLSFGIGLNSANWKIDYTYRIHQAGDTHYFSTGYSF